MNEQKAIGGYFEWEFTCRNSFPNDHCVLVNSSRNALEYILRTILSEQEIKRIFLPYYTCEVVLEPINRLGLPYIFYDIDDNLEINDVKNLQDGEYIIANNYFGIKDSYISNLRNKFPKQLIADNSQALFVPSSESDISFYSPRKFVPAPDGGIACAKGIGTNIRFDDDMEIDESHERCSHLLIRTDIGAEKGYNEFHRNDDKLIGLPLKKMSRLTEAMLRSYDYKNIIRKRKQNYDLLRKALESTNILQTPTSASIACPMVYPFRTTDNLLRQRLIENKIFVAKYWPNVPTWCNDKNDLISRRLTNEIIPLPIDQRYGDEDMTRIIDIIIK